MKIILTLLLSNILAFSVAQAQKSSEAPKKTPEQKICDRLTKQAEDECDESMCEEYTEEGEECVRDGDFYEGHGICVFDDRLPTLIQDYNDTHKKSVTCEDN